ncbi:hypothetical protein PPACK8108_LOCUS10261 [Phakopsora pachyrhizi]|uniref:Uncharacterized protein n=1 Tax=Phakopsora pachyrhizi TaxID=170000 RepID=A0AAV0B1A8_PHAPC|nr:hypothetical protein PPACK8108_LOCUS10261 [Phakopsora pachyrhizi]
MSVIKSGKRIRLADEAEVCVVQGNVKGLGKEVTEIVAMMGQAWPDWQLFTDNMKEITDVSFKQIRKRARWELQLGPALNIIGQSRRPGKVGSLPNATDYQADPNQLERLEVIVRTDQIERLEILSQVDIVCVEESYNAGHINLPKPIYRFSTEQDLEEIWESKRRDEFLKLLNLNLIKKGGVMYNYPLAKSQALEYGLPIEIWVWLKVAGFIIGQSEVWNLTVNAPRGHISFFWVSWRAWVSKDTTP